MHVYITNSSIEFTTCTTPTIVKALELPNVAWCEVLSRMYLFVSELIFHSRKSSKGWTPRVKPLFLLFVTGTRISPSCQQTLGGGSWQSHHIFGPEHTVSVRLFYLSDYINLIYFTICLSMCLYCYIDKDWFVTLASLPLENLSLPPWRNSCWVNISQPLCKKVHTSSNESCTWETLSIHW